MTPAEREISFIVQGAIDHTIQAASGKGSTRTCLDSIRQWFPRSEIVLSTWEGSDVRQLDYDVLVLANDPGACHIARPGISEVILNNGNRQIVSTRSGLKQASGRFAVKLRNDIVLRGNTWLEMWGRFPERAREWRMFRERVITANRYTRNPRREIGKPFHPSDWLMFGLKEDLLRLWDIGEEPEPESSHWFLTRPLPRPARHFQETRRYHPEQYLWKTLMARFGEIAFEHFADDSRENVRLTELTFANNLIVLDVEQFPFAIQKSMHGNPPRAWRYSCLSHREWRRLYQRYCLGDRAGAALDRLTDTRHIYETCYLRIPPGVRSGAKKISKAARFLIEAARPGARRGGEPLSPV
ncbi:MAG: WavE lipopolysaccharide synthesis family protein [Acidobacteriota bacterium]